LWGMSGLAGSEQLRRFRGDCSAVTVIAEVGPVSQLAPVRDESGVFLLSSADLVATLRKVDRHGAAWQVELGAQFDHTDTLMTPGAEGAVLLATVDVSGQLHVRRYAADGALSWSTESAVPGVPIALQARSDGNVLILRQAEADVQLWLDASGAAGEPQNLPHGRYIGDVPQIGA